MPMTGRLRQGEQAWWLRSPCAKTGRGRLRPHRQGRPRVHPLNSRKHQLRQLTAATPRSAWEWTADILRSLPGKPFIPCDSRHER